MKKASGVSLGTLIFAFLVAFSLPLTGWADNDRHSGWDDEDQHGCSKGKQQDIVVHLKRHINDLQGAVTAVRLATLMQVQDCADVTLFLTLQGPRLADNRMPQDLLFGTLPDGTPPEEYTLAWFVQGFLGAGGEIVVCPLCAQEIGLIREDGTTPDLLEGVIVPTPQEIADLFLAADKILDF
jgi:sulfur relay (sulfurtransferase) complex TusBCD TusD component (DsrE family)